MTKPGQGISRNNRGEEQPVDKDRARTAYTTKPDDAAPSKEETRKDESNSPARSGHSQDK
jgi:hypothetical protein